MAVEQTPRTTLGWLYHWETTKPDSRYLSQPIGDGQVVDYTWQQTADEVRRMAAHLRALDLPPKSHIAILGKNSAQWIMADLAIWMAGHVSVPLYPTLAADTIRYILDHSDSKLLFIGKLDGFDGMKPGIPADMPIITLPLSPQTEGEKWADIIARNQPISDSPDRQMDELATIIYTSGSTGQPKGVMQSFHSFYICGTKMNEILSAEESDRMLSYLPLSHVAERIIVETQSLYHGFQVFFAESLDTFVHDLQRARPTIFFSVPRLWTKFELGVTAKMPKEKQQKLFRIPILGKIVKKKILAGLGLDSVRFAFTGAAPLPEPSVRWYRSIGLELLEAYGMTENMAYSHFTRPDNERVGYVGNANLGVECKIGDNGEILTKSPAQMMGYYKDPEKTAESYTADGFYKTGDMGEIDELGRLRITGRVKELFKTSKGKYVAPVPIENRIGAHPAIEASCVGGASQAATFVLLLLSPEAMSKAASPAGRTELETQFKTLLGEVNNHLDPHEQMAFAVIVKEPWSIDNGMLTPTMKIRRNIVEKHYEPMLERWFAARQPVIWE